MQKYPSKLRFSTKFWLGSTIFWENNVTRSYSSMRLI
jgi:hypothetical protein